MRREVVPAPRFAAAMCACALLALSAIAFAQSVAEVECKKTETQAECFVRLKCNANEELDACQKRLLKCTANEALETCEKRVGAGAPKDGTRPGNDANQRRGDRGDQQGDRDTNRGADRDRSDGRDHDDRDRNQRERDSAGGDNRDNNGPRRRRSGARAFEPNKTFGLGLELGEPTGLNGKYFVSKSGALDFGVGYIYDQYYFGDGFHIYADYLWHPISLASTSAFELPFYIGGGLRFWDFNYCYMGTCTYGGTAVGLRIPVGISFDFNNVPLDIFMQLVPVIDFIGGDYYTRYRDREHFGIDFSAGIRYWFK